MYASALTGTCFRSAFQFSVLPGVGAAARAPSIASSTCRGQGEPPSRIVFPSDAGSSYLGRRSHQSPARRQKPSCSGSAGFLVAPWGGAIPRRLDRPTMQLAHASPAARAGRIEGFISIAPPANPYLFTFLLPCCPALLLGQMIVRVATRMPWWPHNGRSSVRAWLKSSRPRRAS